ncbi:MAG: hypothetical protein CM15mP112_00440 [Flavobacteriales bacterium]|nr:MAG: hypothetical protein CM15mP112_00440 [Flavobacteriales bacterium]
MDGCYLILLFVKSSIYKQFGLYNTSLHMAADYDMIIRLLYKFNISANYIPMILVKMRTGGASNASIFDRLIANKQDGLAWTKNQLNKPYFIRIKSHYKNNAIFQKPKI